MELVLGEERLITWDVSKAGPGSMDIEIQGPKYDHRLENAGPNRWDEGGREIMRGK